MTTAERHPSPTPDGRAPTWGATVASVAVLVAAAGLTVGLLIGAALLTLCGLGGSSAECTDEENAAGVALVAALVVYLGVPTLVALVRRDARWLLVPVAEAALAVMAVAANARF